MPKAKKASPAPASSEKQAERAEARLEKRADEIAEAVYPFHKLSDRDRSYLRCYLKHADKSGRVTLAALAALGRNPFYSGSARADDAGVISRMQRAKLATFAGDTLTLTKAGIDTARKLSSKA